MKRLMTWMQREIMRELSAATGVPQKKFKALVRYRASPVPGRDAIEVWIGTNPIKVHHLGNVVWNRRMPGARVGRKSYPHTWAWKPPTKTAPAVMQRTGVWQNGVEKIAPVTEPIHEIAARRIDAIQPRIGDQLERYMLTAMKQQIYLESKK